MKILKKFFVTLCFLSIVPTVSAISSGLILNNLYENYSDATIIRLSQESFFSIFLGTFANPAIIVLLLTTDIVINKLIDNKSLKYYIFKIFFASLYCIPLSFLLCVPYR